MVTLSSKFVVGFGSLALLSTTAVGVAAADPNLSAIVNTSCTYPQVLAALNVQSPDLANQLNTNPMAQSTLQTFLASPPNARQQTVQQLQSTQWGRMYASELMLIANTCNNF